MALVGRPNAGKSSFLNALLDEKVSGVSNKPQTTQKIIKGIYTDADAQIIFLDTPGIHDGTSEWNRAVNANALKSFQDADCVVRFLDSTRPYGQEDEQIDTLLSAIKKPILRVFTKKDLPGAKIPDGALGISIKQIETLFVLVEEICKFLPEGNMYYPEDYYTDQDMNSRIEEVIREKCFLQFEQELPYATFAEIEEIREDGDLLRVMAYIYTETEAQKKIIIGTGGKALSALGKAAREELERIFDRKVFLALRVKVQPKWRKDQKMLGRVFG